MARADMASASARSDSIKGLAQSIAKPAYRRLLTAEPLLRRAVPVLIIGFLATICVGAGVQLTEHRHQTLNAKKLALEAVADVAAARLQPASSRHGPASADPQARLAHALPAWATENGRRFLLADADGIITAAMPNPGGVAGRRLIDVLGAGQPLTTFGASAGVLEITLPDGARALATVRNLPRLATSRSSSRAAPRCPPGAR